MNAAVTKYMNQWMCLLPIAMLVVRPSLTWADTETVDGVVWTYTVSAGKASVGGGSSSSTAVPTSTSGEITIPSLLGGHPVTSIGASAFYACCNLSGVTIPEGVTSIGELTFGNCTGLQTVVIPNSATNIGMGCFSNCTSLVSVHIPDGQPSIPSHMFSGCTQMISVDIPPSVASIGYCAFYCCSGLMAISIPNNVTNIEDGAFYNCNRLTSVTIPNSVTSIGFNAFAHCSGLSVAILPENLSNIEVQVFADCTGLTSISIPHGVTNIGDSAFRDCSALMSVAIPDSVTSIGRYAFRDCSGLVSVSIPDSVTSIGSHGFDGCSGLTSIDIPSSVTNIATGVFAHCAGLTSISIPHSVTSIGVNAFGGCSGLTSVSIPDSVTSIGNSAFFDCNGLREFVVDSGNPSYSSRDGVLLSCDKTMLIACPCGKQGGYAIPDSVTSISASAFAGCSGLTSVDIPNSVRTIGTSAFFSCAGLAAIGIPDSVASISDNAFSGCNGLRSVDIPNSVRAIGASAFASCTGLAAISIPDRVVSIGNRAFFDCSELTRMTIPDSVTRIGTDVFSGCNRLACLSVPMSWKETSKLDGTGVPEECWIFYRVDGENIELEEVDGVFWGYRKNEQEATVVAMGRFDGNVLSIPPTLGGVPVTGIEMEFASFTNITDVALPASVTNIVPEAFRGCSGVESVVVPQGVCSSRLSDVFPDAYKHIADVEICAGVTSIGEGAFAGCLSLKSVSIPNDVKSIGDCAFEGCGLLESMVIPNGVLRLGDGVFRGCSALAEVGIPDGVECLGDDVFEGCAMLGQIHLPVSLVDWGLRSLPPTMQQTLKDGTEGFLVVNGWVLGYSDSGVSALALPEGTVGVGNHALANFWDLERVGMPDSLRFIGRGAFETNTYLDNLVIPAGVEWVRDGAFQGCTYIRNLTIGESVGHIGRRAFAGCTQLATVTVPESVEEIGDEAFSNCWRMLSVKLPLGLAEAGTGIFADCQSLTGVTMPTHAFTAERLFEERYAALESVTVVEGETALCNGVFEGCTALASATLPEGIAEIGALAFAGCCSLPGIEMPGTVGRIGNEAFKGCTGLRAIVLPDSVEDVGVGVFRNCSNLENATLSRSLKAVPDEAFAGCRQLASMVVPASVKRLGKGIGEWFQGLYLLGNAPEYDEETYTPRRESLTTYVVQGSRGWDGIPSSRDLPAAWIGNPITFWEPNRFDAHFDANGGEFIDGSAVWSCEQITGVGYVLPPYVPTLEGAEFDGWWTDPSEGAQIKATTRVNETREITFYAHWKGSPVPVTVRFNANGGTVTPAEGTYTATMPYGELPVPTRAHYSFCGWWTAAEGGRQIVASSRVPGADQELFAHWVWSPEEYVVQFHANGGEGAMANQHFIYGNVVTLHTNAFQRDGWVFAGWALSEDGAAVYADGATLAQVAVNEEGILHLYAAWRGGTYAVRFDANGGVGRMDNQTFEIGKAEALSLCQFSREGFRFLGWALTSGGEVIHEDGATVLDLTTEPDASVVLYAVWEKLPEPEALPEIADDSEVAGVLAAAGDPRLGEHIQTVADYRDFREWALSVKGSDGELAGAAAVLASEHAWPSYLLGVERLFENEPDISLGRFEVGQPNGAKTAGGTSMFVSVTVKDGGMAVAVDAAKVAALFECTGDVADWTEDALMKTTATQTGEEGDILRFEVVPEDGSAERAFLRIGE